MNEALGILETTGFTPAMVALDAMEKTAGARVLQVELNDFYGVVLKVLGPVANVKAAVDRGREIATQMGGKPVATVLNHPDARAWPAIESRVEYNPLIQQNVVHTPASVEPAAPTGGSPGGRASASGQATSSASTHASSSASHQETSVSSAPGTALGFIETQGFTAVFEAIDSACKAANVDVVGKEKLGGGYVTVVVRGDVAAVKAAIDAGRAKVEGLGKLIAAHVIPRPSAQVLGLLPKV